MRSALSKYVDVDRKWLSIVDSYRLAPLFAPINLDVEKQKFIEAYQAGKWYTPQFQYEPIPPLPVRSIQTFAASLSPDSSIIEGLYYKAAQQELLSIHALTTRSPGDITGASCLSYGLPSTELLAEAEKILNEAPSAASLEPPVDEHDAAQAAKVMQEELHRVGATEWSAEICSPMSARIAVNAKDKQVKIRVGAVFSDADLRRLLVHEVGVHVVRSVNGQRQPLSIMARGLPGYLETEEGLAVYSEKQAGLLQHSTLKIYAARVMAASLSFNRSFGEVFGLLASQIGPDAAFDVVARAKRGFVDPSQPGAHTKDIIYLRGYLRVTHHLTVSPQDHVVLMLGKLGLNDLPWVKKYLTSGELNAPQILPSQRQNQN